MDKSVSEILPQESQPMKYARGYGPVDLPRTAYILFWRGKECLLITHI